MELPRDGTEPLVTVFAAYLQTQASITLIGLMPCDTSATHTTHYPARRHQARIAHVILWIYHLSVWITSTRLAAWSGTRSLNQIEPSLSQRLVKLFFSLICKMDLGIPFWTWNVGKSSDLGMLSSMTQSSPFNTLLNPSIFQPMSIFQSLNPLPDHHRIKRSYPFLKHLHHMKKLQPLIPNVRAGHKHVQNG